MFLFSVATNVSSISSFNSSTSKANSTTTNEPKINCAVECPCGVSTIPVPDQWLEVFLVGGFKVWHILFIVIAILVTSIVIYCCLHRCRIPRTKQEIEMDLLRTNLTAKFRQHLQNLPPETATFADALKKVQELEEKLEQEHADSQGARKRIGWLKLKGKDQQQEKHQKQGDAIISNDGLAVDTTVKTEVVADKSAVSKIEAPLLTLEPNKRVNKEEKNADKQIQKQAKKSEELLGDDELKAKKMRRARRVKRQSVRVVEDKPPRERKKREDDKKNRSK